MQTKGLTKCNFCRYWTGRGCMVTPNYINCKEANLEFQLYLKGEQQLSPVKSFRKWDRK